MSQKPTAADYASDLDARYRTYGANAFTMPPFALDAIGAATRRALYAEQLLATIYGCTSIRAVHALIEQSGIPGYDTTIPQEQTQPVTPA